MTLLVNPRAGGGQGALHAERARVSLERVAEVRAHVTTSAGDLGREAAAAATRGDGILAVLGGDGSVSLAARALMEAGGRTALAIFAAGTGNDLAKSIGAPVHDYDAMAGLVGRGAIRRIDVGTVDDVSFVNAAGFGFDAETIARMTAGAGVVANGADPSRRSSAGRVSYARAALRVLWSYEGFLASVSAAGSAGSRRESRLMLVFANGCSFGGAFRIAPAADVADGALDMISIGAASPVRRLSLFARAVRGTHVECAEVTTARGASFEVRFDAPPLFEADGELYQARSSVVQVRCLPGALAVVAPGWTGGRKDARPTGVPT